MNIFSFIKRPPVTIEIYVNKMVAICHDEPARRVEIIPDESFTSERMLIGHFLSASKCVQQARKKLGISKFHLSNPSVKIVPKAFVDDVSLIEKRAFQELGHRFGSDDVEVVIS